MNESSADPASRVSKSLFAVAAALVMLPVPLPAPVIALALAVTFLVTPGALAMSWLGALADPGERLLASIALSPALAGGAAAVLVAAGASPMLAARFLAAILFVFAVAAALWPRDLDATATSAGDTSPTRIAPAVLWGLVVAAFLVGNRWLPPRSDGWFHAGVTLEIARRGLPVEDPSYAGLRLLYFWGTDLWASLWLARAPGLAVWTPLIALNLAAAVTAILAVCSLARRLGAGAAGQWLAAGLAILGYSPFAWGWAAARAAGGEVRGFDELHRLFDAGADTALRALGVGQLHASLATFADKFLVLTPFGLGLALFGLFLIALREAADRSDTRSAILLALVLAATLFTHTVAGLSALAVTGAWGVFGVMRGGAARRAVPRVALAAAAGALLIAPYLLAVTRGKHAGLAPGLSREAIGSLVLGGALLVPAGIRGAWSAARARPIAGDLLIAMGVLLLLGLLLRLPESNQAKFFNLLFLAAAPAAALAVIAIGARAPAAGRIALACGLAVALIPTAALWVRGFALERGQGLDSWHFPAPSVAAGFEWLDRHTPRNCVVADEGGAREPMVFAARSALAPGASLDRDWGYPPAATAARRRASRELVARGPISSGTDSLLRALGREVVVVERRAGAPGDAARRANAAASAADSSTPLLTSSRRPGYTLLHDGGAIAFWRVELRR